MDFLNLVVVAFIGTLIVQIIAYTYALKSNRVDIIDSAWGISFIMAVLMMQIFESSNSMLVLIADLLVILWGVRLSWHIFKRFRRSQIQDERYTDIMKKWPKNMIKVQILLRIFLVQAVLATLIILPVIVIHHFKPSITLISIIGILVWLTGFIIESLADKQLKEFLANKNHPDLMQEKLWRYSRHPNYFGEVTMWWGIALLSISTSLWFVGIIGALTITILICFISGVPLSEKRFQNKKGWINYKRRTSILIPWPPKKTS